MCGVKVLEGTLAPPDRDELAGLTRAPAGVRLACRARVVGPVRVRPLIAARSVQVSSGPRVTGSRLVAGVDLGTTNVSAAVVELAGGREVGRATVPNRQASFGADVMTRISVALEGEANALTAAARESVAEALFLASGSAVGDIEQAVVAGNSAMAAMLAGVDSSSLATAPYVAPETPDTVDPGWAALRSSATLRVLGPIASFVGGDVLAGLIALDVASHRDPVLLVDVGTNAEIALWAHGRLTVASAAAGPAFEGVRGLTGSELVNSIAELRVRGTLGADGLLDTASPDVFTGEDGVRMVRLGDGDDAPILSQLDVRSVQLAKAAVRVAMESVLRTAGVDAARLARVWVAGAFGGALDPEAIVGIGMIPRAVRDVLEMPGNTSLAGAVSVALSGPARSTELLLADVRHVDLPNDPAFTRRLMDSLRLEAEDRRP